MRLWRLGAAAWPLWSGEGARLHGGRWNQKGTSAIYAATSFALGVLEIMVHANIGRVPHGIRFISIDIPDDAAVDHAERAALDDWNATPPVQSVAYGTAWLRANRGLVMIVPSAVTSGLDFNAVINPHHSDFARATVSEEAPVRLDPRLFPSRG